MKQETLQLTTGSGKTKRRELDFYPTPPECTEALIEFIGYREGQRVLEPACGDGAISKVLLSKKLMVLSSDIADRSYGFSNVDFLQMDDNKWFDFIITNPPFNKSEEFILKALPMARTVCMLMKCQYWHSKKRLKLFTEHPPAFILPLTWRPNFMFDTLKKSSPTMDVSWTVWIKGTTRTIYQPLSKP